MKRRDFLKRSGGAAALGLGLFGTRRGRADPNDTLRVAVVGLRGRGGSHIRGFIGLKGVQVAALCDVDERQIARRVKDVTGRGKPKPQTASDMRYLFDDRTIDAVSFATPNHWHSLGAIWACQAGKDVYVEKPCSHNVREGRILVEAARKHHRIVQHGTQCRSNPGIQEAMRKLREGIIGEVYMARGLCYKWRNTIGHAEPEDPPPGVDYDLWLGPAPKRPFTRNRFHYNWHWFWDTGNGDIGNQGVHQMDLARWGLGVGLPKRVMATGAKFMFDDDQETPNVLEAGFWYPEEKKMLVFAVRHWITNHEGMGSGSSNAVGVTFYGSEGYMVIPSYTSWYTILGRKREPGPKGSGGGDHFQNFIDAVRSRDRGSLHAEIAEGHLSAALCHLANISHRTGRSIDFDPKTEAIIGDEEASRLLTREYRKPFVVPEKV